MDLTNICTGLANGRSYYASKTPNTRGGMIVEAGGLPAGRGGLRPGEPGTKDGFAMTAYNPTQLNVM